MKEQNIKIKLNISGINDEEAAGILARDSLGQNWVVKKRESMNIALVKDHFLMYWPQYGENHPEAEKNLELISSYCVNLTSAPFEMEDIHSVLNLLEVLRRNGAVCTRSHLSANIEPGRGRIFTEVKKCLAKAPLLQTMMIFEPLQIKYSTYYHMKDTEGMDNVNHLVNQLREGKNLDILLDGMGIISNTPLSQLDYSREVTNAIWGDF